MTNEVEKTCQVCLDEMDITDTELKPCICGYTICLWCWHEITELAEKHNTKGRCPACRAIYDTEQILGASVNLDRVAKINSGRKRGMKKAMSKASRKKNDVQISPAILSKESSDWSNLRVIQKNVVYIPAIQAHFADEETLRKKEFLGQYGRILHIFFGQAAFVEPNSSPRNFRSVYASFSKVDEALHCICVVDGFTLDGLNLKASFGAAKYCDLWLNNKPCYRKNCLYLHHPGNQEDICKKDEVLSVSKSKLQRAGVTSNHPQRYGSCLPPPLQDYRSNDIPVHCSKPLSCAVQDSTKKCWVQDNRRHNSCQQTTLNSMARFLEASVAATQAPPPEHPQVLSRFSSYSACVKAQRLSQSLKSNQSDRQSHASTGYRSHTNDGSPRSYTSTFSESCSEDYKETIYTLSHFPSISSEDELVVRKTVDELHTLHMNGNNERPLASQAHCVGSNLTAKEISLRSNCSVCSTSSSSNLELECADYKEVQFLPVDGLPSASLAGKNAEKVLEIGVHIDLNISTSKSEEYRILSHILSLNLDPDSYLPDLHSLEEIFSNKKGVVSCSKSFCGNRNESQFLFARKDNS